MRGYLRGPKVQSILTKPFAISYDDLAKVMDENCSIDDAGWLTFGVDKWAPKAYLDQFFLRPGDPEAYDASKHAQK